MLNSDTLVFTCHSSDPPPFLKGREVNFKYLPQRGGFQKLKKGGGSMVQGQVFLKGGGAGTFPV